MTSQIRLVHVNYFIFTLDIPLLKYTSMVNGYSAIALTKLDILDDLDEIQIGITYKKNETPMEHFPSCEQVSIIWGKNCKDSEMKNNFS